MNNLYALLAGINTYHPQTDANVPNLHGCINDVQCLQTFLENQFPQARRNIVALPDGDATYQNVIDHFGDQLLLRAGQGDVVLFAYSGHGSQELAAPEFSKYYPSGKEESLVLYDSRIPGGLDLADKELAILIERVALRGAHVVVLLDCCHSGSGTRGAEEFLLGAARQASSRTDRRSLDSYLQGEYRRRTDFYLPNSRHVLLAACDRTEKAFELTSRRGLFSTQLLQVLEKTGGRLSYADLALQCRLAMSQVTDRQHPQFETSGYFNGYDGFLGLSTGSAGVPLRVFFEKNTWQATMGAIHGLPVGPGKSATFEVLKDGEVVGEVCSKVVGPGTSSLVSPDFPLPPGDYEARLTSLPSPKLMYWLKAQPAKVKEAQQALQRLRAVHFDLRTDVPQAAFRLEVAHDNIRILRSADEVLICNIEGDDWDKMFASAFEKLEHIARWTKTMELDNPDSKMDRNDVELILVELDSTGKELHQSAKKEAVIDIFTVNGQEQPVMFRLDVRNKNPQKVRHCALFYASEKYGFRPIGFNEEVPKATTVVAAERTERGERHSFYLDGRNEGIDTFRLLVSNVKINDEALRQKGFKVLGSTEQYWRADGGMRSVEELAQAKAVFGMDDDEESMTEDINDWYALTLRVKSVARQATVGEQPVALANQFITIHPHPSFRAGVALTAVNAGSRSIEPMSVVAELAKHSGVELLPFGETTRDVAPVNMLELSGLENEASLAEQPLRMEVAAQLRQSDHQEDLLLPLTFDGEHLIPVGEVQRLDNGNALVSIAQLPDTVEGGRRSLGKALKLVFLKLVLKKEDVQALCWVDYSGAVAERRTEGLANKVAAAKNILLVIHGIIGDTQGMAECMRPACDGQSFNLVLTFDYENLNTKIEVTAARLADKLREAGITPEAGKKITILAHSMGGLVARYFIENMQGNQVVQHLLMAGTPNGGSAIAKVTTYRDYLLPLLTLAINSPWGIPAAATLLAIMKGSKLVTPTLEQMNYDHPDGFLKNLAKAGDPGVRYSIVAGDLQQYLNGNAEQQKLMDKLLGLGGKLFYEGQPNDLAVSVEGIQAVPMQRQPVPVAVVVPGNHMNYFAEQGCVEALMGFLKKPA